MVELARRACVLLAAAALASAACAGVPTFGASGDRPAETLAGDAIRNLATASSVHLTGSVVDARGHQLGISVTTTRSGSQGSLSVDGLPVEVVTAGDRAYYRGAAFWAVADPRNAKLYGNSWVRAQPAGLPGILAELARAGAVADGLSTRRHGLRKGDSSTIDDRPVIALSDRVGAVYVSAGSPTRLLRIVDSQEYVRPDGGHDLRLDFDYPDRRDVEAPAAYIDPTDPSTMPARIVVVTTANGRCDATGCEQVVTVRNTAGPPTAQSVVTVRLVSGAGAQLGSCTVGVPPIGYNVTQEVRCTVTGAAWTAFARTSGTKNVRGRATIQNPPYD